MSVPRSWKGLLVDVKKVDGIPNGGGWWRLGLCWEPPATWKR